MAKPKELERCNAPGCKNPAKRKGICADHIAANYVLGCTEEGCDHELFAKGRCKAHYMRRYRKKNGEPAPASKAPVRKYGEARFDVFTRIPEEAAEVILKAAGRRDGMYEKAKEILVKWAERHAA